jgi:hypothetical protein
MNKLPEEKRNQLILVAVGTLGVVVAIWLSLISLEQSALRNRDHMVAQMERKVETARQRAALADRYKQALTNATGHLQAIEDRMAAGDVYLWLIKTLQDFQKPYHVNISNFDPPQISDSPVLPKVPYQSATCAVLGTANYHDLEIFLAHLEATFPYIRVQRVELEPLYLGRAGSGDDAEKLTFKLELATLIKPSAAHPAD